MRRPKVAQTGLFSYLAYRLASAGLGVLPRAFGFSVAEGAAKLLARRKPEEQAVVAANLRHVVGPIDDLELDALVRRSFAAYGRYWAEVAKLRPRDARHLDACFDVVGFEHIEAARLKGGIVFALPHLGAWEVGGLWARGKGLSLVTVAEDASSERLSRWFEKRRARLGLQVLRLSADTPAKLLAELRSGGTIALVADRDVGDDGIEVTFFGARTRVPAGPAVFALRTGASIIPCVIYQERGRYRAIFGPPLDTERRGRLRDDVERVTSELIEVFEGYIAAAPEQWHVFQPNWPESDVQGHEI